MAAAYSTATGVTEAKRDARRAIGTLAVLLGVIASSHTGVTHAAQCVLERFAELPVTMSGTRPIVHAKINGADAAFIADSGAFYSWLTPAAAAEYKLPLSYSRVDISGTGGIAQTWLTRVRTFTFFNLPIPDVDFFVSGNDLGEGVAGVIGQNVFRIGDVEYDLANGIIRIIQPKNCRNAALAYWAIAGQKPFSEIDIELANRFEPFTMGEVYVNGTKLRVIFDTGASTSVMTLEAAKRLGVTPTSPGVVAGGEGYGVGHRANQSWIAPFASFRIGDEEVRNTRLRFGNIALRADMLVGADFFLSHRIYVASSQRKLYFTYNGGPVFDLHAPPATAASTAPAGAPAAADSSAQPQDAAAFARRGAASLGRDDYAHAIADLTRACELAPTVPDYFYERGVAYLSNRQPDLALADFDRAIKLEPESVPALVARASLRTARHDPATQIVPDLDTADSAAPVEDQVHLDLGQLYRDNGRYAAAVAQFSKWIDSHTRDDVHMSAALNERCYARAAWGQELDQALEDCDRALKLSPRTASYLDSRAVVYLKKGNYAQSIQDYDAALQVQPKLAIALYGRGVAKLRKGETEAGNADISAAKAMEPAVADRAARSGIVP